MHTGGPRFIVSPEGHFATECTELDFRRNLGAGASPARHSHPSVWWPCTLDRASLGLSRASTLTLRHWLSVSVWFVTPCSAFLLLFSSSVLWICFSPYPSFVIHSSRSHFTMAKATALFPLVSLFTVWTVFLTTCSHYHHCHRLCCVEVVRLKMYFVVRALFPPVTKAHVYCISTRRVWWMLNK